MLLTRRYKGAPPGFTFTADFHQLVHGDRLPGPCLLRYDPFRIVPPSDYASPGPVECFVCFLPSGRLWQQSLPIPPYVLRPEYWDASGQGFMLETTFTLPEDCDELEFWFSYVDSDGSVRWDSAGGENYYLRFPTYDLTQHKAAIVSSADPAFDRLQVQVSSVSKVKDVEVRWRVTAPVALPRWETALIPSPGEEGSINWSTPDGGVPVPTNSTAVFDLVYHDAHGHRYKDDNAGTYYLAEPTTSTI
jgi:hypothetical protein